jgi:hypothetical protein
MKYASEFFAFNFESKRDIFENNKKYNITNNTDIDCRISSWKGVEFVDVICFEQAFEHQNSVSEIPFDTNLLLTKLIKKSFGVIMELTICCRL